MTGWFSSARGAAGCGALIYQHATRDRDEAIAAGMGKLLRQARRKKAGERTGTQRARAPKQAS
jgi:hypothetical protein